MTDIRVCNVDGARVYGSPGEAQAARLNPGERVWYRGARIGSGEGVVRSVMFYDGIVVSLRSGLIICPNLGDEIGRAE